MGTMTEEDKAARRAEVYAAQRMSDFINDELMQDHFNGLLHGWQNMWLDEMDPTKREELWQNAHALKTFIESLRSVITTGDMAAAQLRMDAGEENE